MKISRLTPLLQFFFNACPFAHLFAIIELGYEMQRDASVISGQRSIGWGFWFWAFRKRLPFTLTLTIFSLTCVAVYEIKAPKFYEASSLIRLHTQTPNSSPPQPQPLNVDLKTATQLVGTSLTVQEALNLIEGQKLKGMSVSDSVRRYLSSLSVQDILSSIRVTGYEPDLIRISARHTSPEVAAVLANAIAEAFVVRLNREILAEASDERRFVETQLEVLHAGLQRLDKQIIEVERQLNAVNIPTEAIALVNFVRIFAADLMMVEVEIRDAIRAGEKLQQIPADSSHVALYRSVIEGIERRRVELEERVKLLSTLLQQTHHQLRRFPEQQRSLSDLVRQLQVLGQAYVSLLYRLQSVQTKELAGLSSATIVNPAFVPNKPMGLGSVWLIFLALLGSLAVGVGLTLLLESLNPSIRSLDELESIFGAPLLSVIPEAKLKLKPEGLMWLMTSRHSVAEAIRMLRANLRFAIMRRSRGNGMKVFLITSATKGEGKSFVAAALGIAFAQIGKRVVIVDANLLSPDLQRFFGVDGNVGLADVLKGTASIDEALMETNFANLRLLPARAHLKESTPANSARLFNPEAVLGLLQRLREQFDLVLIDTPPMMAVTDPSVLASMADGVLLVVDLGSVTKTVAQRVKEQLDLAQAKIVGIVINKASRRQGYDYRDYPYLALALH